MDPVLVWRFGKEQKCVAPLNLSHHYLWQTWIGLGADVHGLRPGLQGIFSNVHGLGPSLHGLGPGVDATHAANPQEKSSNTNNNTNTNSNTVQYCCEVFRFLTVVKRFGSLK